VSKRHKEDAASKGAEIIDYEKVNAEEALKLLESDLSIGLKAYDVEDRLNQYGFNEIIEKKPNLVIRFFKKFWGLTAWLLEIIIILSWILQRYLDFYIVIVLLVFNSILGFFEEQHASKALETLKKKLQVNARVIRDHIWKIVPARELVPGDIIRIRAGDFVPADVKIIEGELEVDQSALTGESMEVEKTYNNMLYSGSVVKEGEATGIIILTGINTYFGKMAQLVQIARPKFHLEELVSKVVEWLLFIIVILLSLTIIFSLLKGINLIDILPLLLVLLLSAIPVALPVMFTISTAIGAMDLAKKGVLITRLNASEDAATMDILCADKTGTLTRNKLSIVNVIPLNEFKEHEIILYGALASQEANQDPIDLAFIRASKQKNLESDEFIQKNFIPFDPKRRRTEALVQKGNQEFKVMKGAVNIIAQICGLEPTEIKDLETKLELFTKKGYRSLAVAKTNVQNELKLTGLVSLYDMPRADSKLLIEELKNLGISVKMLTGDSTPIAKEIAKDLGLGENIVNGADLRKFTKEHPTKAAEIAEKSDGFAEIYPEDKYTIVKNLQVKNHTIGMTGDGMNDSPALRQAEVGIAVSNATDIAKSAASVILTNEGLTDVVELIKIGRTIYERISAWILSKIIRTLQMATLIVLTFLITGFYIVSAFAIILLFFMTDFVKITLSTDNIKWSKTPYPWNIGGLVKVAVILSLLVIIESFGLLYLGFTLFHLTMGDEAIYTFTFEILFFFAMFLIFNVREKGHFWDSKPSNLLLITILFSTIATIIVSTVGIPGLKPLPLLLTCFIIIYVFLFSLIFNDLIKFILVKKNIIRW
jgi:H+-transporting ATPase